MILERLYCWIGEESFVVVTILKDAFKALTYCIRTIENGIWPVLSTKILYKLITGPLFFSSRSLLN